MAGRWSEIDTVARRVLRAALCLIALAAFLCFPGALRAEPSRTITMQLPAPALNVSAGDGIIVACLGLKGTAIIAVDEDSSPTLLAVREDVPSLYSTFLPEGRLLLGGRDGNLYRMDASHPACPKKLNTWPVEGIPMSVNYAEGRITVASGAAGVLLFDWEGGNCAPVLRGRYPFVDYSKEARFGPGGRLYLADNRDTGMQVLDVSSTMRPTRLASCVFDDFADNIAIVGRRAVVGSRRNGVVVFDVSGPQPRLLGSVQTGRQFDPRVLAVEAIGDNEFVVAEGEAGTRIYRFSAKSPEAPAELVETLPGSVANGISLAVAPNGNIVIGGIDGTLTIWIRDGAKP